MLERWYPTAHVPSVFAIDYEKLAALGYKGNRHQIPDAQHMAADVAVGAPPENGLPVDGAPRQTGQKAARTGAQQGRHRAAVNGDERRQAQHFGILRDCR